MPYKDNSSQDALGLMDSKKRTVLRTIRVPLEIDRVIQLDASVKGISENVLLNLILRRHVESYRYEEKIGVIVLPKVAFRNILENSDESIIEKIARDQGREDPREMIRFSGNEINLGSFLKFLSQLSRYNNWFSYEHSMIGNEHIIILHHDMGARWSKFMGGYLSEAVQNLFGAVIQVEEQNSYVSLRFTLWNNIQNSNVL